MKQTTRHLLALLAALPSTAVFACASCGCSINSDWSAQGVSASAGWSLDLRLDDLNQNKLWSGTKAISAAAAAATIVPGTGDAAEVEQYTHNHYLTATLAYSDGEAWGLSLGLPTIRRTHSTLGVGSDGASFDPANGAYTSAASGLGDLRVVGRWFGFSDLHNIGLQLGLKLPTGQKNQLANDGVTPVDPGLQLGTGTTDLIVGGYVFGDLAPDWGYFTQATFQTALNHSTMAGGSYKPGDSVGLSLGVRYTGLASFVTTLQLNARQAQVDSGAAADTYSTGGKLVYLTLGGMLPLWESFVPYAHLQLPIYQNVNGIQLTPKVTLSVGVKVAF